MSLSAWFEEHVGLSGNQLIYALECCRKGQVETVEQLEQLGSRLDYVFGKGLVLALVEDALSLANSKGGLTSSDELTSYTMDKSGSKLKVVHVAIHIISVSQINMKQHSFSCDFFLVYHWGETKKNLKKIKMIEEDLSGSATLDLHALKQYWRSGAAFVPKAEIVNCTAHETFGDENEQRFWPRLDSAAEGYVKQTTRINATFGSNFALERFPFDTQELNIHFKFRTWCGIKMAIMQSEFRKSRLNLNNIEHSDLIVLPCPVISVGKARSSTDYYCTLISQRNWGRYLWDVIAMNLAFVAIAWLIVCCVPADDVIGRGTLILALLLTATASKSAVTGTLPQLSYLSMIDKYVLGCFICLFLLIGDVFLIGSMIQSTKDGGLASETCQIWRGWRTCEADKTLLLQWDPETALKAPEVEKVILTTIAVLWGLFNVFSVYHVSNIWLEMRKDREANKHMQHIFSSSEMIHFEEKNPQKKKNQGRRDSYLGGMDMVSAAYSKLHAPKRLTEYHKMLSALDADGNLQAGQRRKLSQGTSMLLQSQSKLAPLGKGTATPQESDMKQPAPQSGVQLDKIIPIE